MSNSYFVDGEEVLKIEYDYQLHEEESREAFYKKITGKMGWFNEFLRACKNQGLTPVTTFNNDDEGIAFFDLNTFEKDWLFVKGNNWLSNFATAKIDYTDGIISKKDADSIINFLKKLDYEGFMKFKGTEDKKENLYHFVVRRPCHSITVRQCFQSSCP